MQDMASKTRRDDFSVDAAPALLTDAQRCTSHHLPERAIVDKLRAVAVRRTFAPGEVVLCQGERPACVALLVKGLVKLAIQREDGRELVVGTRAPEGALGTLALMANVPQPFRVEAVTPCVTNVVPANAFQSRVDEDVLFARAVLSLHALEALDAYRVDERGSARDRIAQLLRTIARSQCTRDGSGWIRVPLPVTHEALAALAGVTPETFSRALAQMESDRLVERGRGWLRVRVAVCGLDAPSNLDPSA